MIRGIKKIGEFVRKETVLSVALFLAVISAFIVPPDSAYVDYIDFRTLAILFCLMTVVAGFSQQGIFNIVAKSMINRMGSLRAVTFVLTFMCFFFSMFITNDVSLITFVPMTLTVLGMAGEEVLTRWMVPVITLQTIAANLGSMLTPIGNPQNLYLYGLAGISAGRFMLLMLPYTIASAVLLVLWIVVCMKDRNRQLEIRLSGDDIQVDKKLLGIYGILFGVSLLTVAQASQSAVAQIISGAQLPQQFQAAFINAVNTAPGATTMSTLLSQTIVNVSLSILSFLICFLGCYIVASFLIHLICYVFELPVLRHLDALMGGVFGLARGVLLLFIFFALVPIIQAVVPVQQLTDVFTASRLAPLFDSQIILSILGA